MHQPCPLCLLIGVVATVGVLLAAAALWARSGYHLVDRDARAEEDEWRAWSG